MTATAIVLAAGRGERLRPLTDHTPKPLLPVGPHRLIEHHLLALSAAGVREVVINTAWLEAQFAPALGDGSRYGLRLHYSAEMKAFGQALETAGGIAHALPHLEESFWVVSGDVLLPGFTFDEQRRCDFARSPLLARLWLVPNAPHHPQGDFGIDDQGLAVRDGPGRLTYASVGLFKAEMFRGIVPGTRMALRPLLEWAIDERRLGAERWTGTWIDVGTVERLEQARDWVREHPSLSALHTDLRSHD